MATDAAQGGAGLSDGRACAVLIGRGPVRPHARLAAGHGMLGISMSTGGGQRIADHVLRPRAGDRSCPYRPSDSDEHCTL
ncbi:hypothetical protein FEO90_14600 [Stenotrophomonas maltophilia]|nr:hypothetical protein FEO90_14600 [Stenotrophomonas maltophilia]